MVVATHHEPPEFKTIGEVSAQLALPQHVLRFWETQFAQVRPAKRRGGRRFYANKDIEALERIKALLYTRGYTIRGAKKALNQNFIPSNDFDMKIKDKRQIDIFEAIEKPTMDEKRSVRKVLETLKQIQKLLKEND